MKSLLLKLLSILIIWISPIADALLGIGILIFLDLSMGLIAAYKLKIPITSSRLKNTGVKLLVYNLLVISAFVAESKLAPLIPFINICTFFIATIEITSISENFEKITGLPFLKFIKDKLNDRLNNKDQK